jgi:hypothetical protein
MSGYDPAPVLALFPSGNDVHIARHLGVSHDAVRLWRREERRLRLSTAELVAQRLGLHPANLWPDEWAS